MSTSAALVRSARTRADLTVRALAERAGTAYTTVSRIENGQLDPTTGMLERLLRAAGRDLVLDSRPIDVPRLAALVDAWSTDARGQHRPDWTRLRANLDVLTAHPELRGPATVDRPEASGSLFMDNLLAGIAEKLSDDAGLPRPAWTRNVPALSEPWSSPMTPRMRAVATSSTPSQLADRNITMTADSLWREENSGGG